MSKTKEQIQKSIAKIDRALQNTSGLSPEQIRTFKDGRAKFVRMLAELEQPANNGEPAKALTEQQEAQRQQNIANVQQAKEALLGMESQKKPIQRQPKGVEEVATIEPIATGVIRVVSIPWSADNVEKVTEKQCRGKLKSAFDDLMENNLVKQGRVGELDASASMGRCATYLKALVALSGSVPAAEFFGFKSPAKIAVYNAVLSFYEKNDK